ncbi:Mitochondrial-processing peptidase subunit alpha [Vitis vinifera]|uniref:Mitochondrial-processing peptidase subunit alpha n=1 Tax=Vitis vinifera TaxID=29760 RepID=A0A438ECJ3_VITVI|nr:Mitochondrial-processing peptidase subunit alpha [Vitis vinifera]
MEGSDFVAKAIDIAAGELLSIASLGQVDQVQLTRAKEATKSAVLMNLESRMIASEDIGRQILTYGERYLNLQGYTPIFCVGVLDSLAVELKATKDFSKLYAGIAILGYIASVPESVNTRAFSHLLTFLAIDIPRYVVHTKYYHFYSILNPQNFASQLYNKLSLADGLRIRWRKRLKLFRNLLGSDIEEAKQRRLELHDMAGLETGLLPKIGNGASNRDVSHEVPTSHAVPVGSVVPTRFAIEYLITCCCLSNGEDGTLASSGAHHQSWQLGCTQPHCRLRQSGC